MRYSCTLALIMFLAGSARASDLTDRIKNIAQRYAGSTEAGNGETTYTIFAFQPVRGYRNLLSAREYADGTAFVFVTIFEQERSGDQRITILVDKAGDGRLEYRYVVTGKTIDDAYARLSGDNVAPVPVSADDRRMYGALLDIVNHTPGKVASR